MSNSERWKCESFFKGNNSDQRDANTDGKKKREKKDLSDVTQGDTEEFQGQGWEKKYYFHYAFQEKKLMSKVKLSFLRLKSTF